MNEDDAEEEFEDHVKDNNFDEDVDEDVHVDEGVHIVRNNESITDDNFDMYGQGIQQDESDDESVEEDNAPMNNPVEDPVEDRRPPMVRRLDSNLDRPRWESTGAHMVSAMMVAEQAGVGMMKNTLKSKHQKRLPNMD